jgi:hypothetical protein
MFDGQISADRDFEGFGPTLGLSGSADLLGNADTGKVDLDWSLTGAVLFGRQSADVEGLATDSFYSAPGISNYIQRPAPTSVTPTDYGGSRSHRATVPSLGGSLGLSYSVGRVGISTGYSWERYFDVIDGGINDRQTYDRTIQGPFLKLKVGFGS